MTRKLMITLLLLAVSYVVTITMSINGPIVPMIRSEFGLPYGSLGLLFSSMAAGLLITSLVGGLISDRLGRMRAIILLLILAGIAQWALSLITSISQAYLLWFATGICLGPLVTVFQSTLSDVHGEDRGRVLSLSAMVASIGALSAPIVATIVVNALDASWRGVFRVTGCCFILLAVLFALVRRYEANIPYSKTTVVSLTSIGSLVKSSRKIRRYTVVASLGAAIEWTFSFWLVSFLVASRSIDLSESQLLLSIFYVSMLIGRLLLSTIARSSRIRNLMIGSAAIGVLGSLLILASPWTILSVFLIGLALCGMYPLALSQAIAVRPDASAAISGVVVVSVYTVSMILPALAGVMADRFGVTFGFALGLLGFVPLMLAVVAANTASNRTESQLTPP